MSDAGLCQSCGNVLPEANVLGGGCPRCLLEMGFESVAGSFGKFETTNDSDPPAAIGRYRILRRIGEGGMGTVYEAEQSQPRRAVALKIIKPGMASPDLMRRFEQESQALGRLQHPGIAQIYEAGTVDTGFGPQPYFAMEFIRGLSPRDYADERHLSTRERLEIMVKICDAVHHAHQRGIIHRDLKPGNILIDETGQPKILDFGVARVTDSDSRATVQTDLGQLIGTLAYMSPEQVLADPLDIDTRSDVYSLGVILYEFLSGRLPYPISKKLHENIQTIREKDQEKLSAVNRIFRGDIETMVAKALEKDRTRRYASAAGMAADIQRFLKDEPIVARPPSTSYQLRKFAHRHKALVAGVTAVFVVLVAGIVVATSLASSARHERDRAVRLSIERDRALKGAQTATEDSKAQRDRAESATDQARKELLNALAQTNRADTEASKVKALLEFVGIDLLGKANPYLQTESGQSNAVQAVPNPNVTLKEALDLSVKKIPSRFERQPLQEAAMREFVGDVYVGMGSYREGRDQLEIAVKLRRGVQGDTDPETIRTTAKLADVCADLNLFQRAEELARKIVLDAHRSPGNADASLRAAVSTLVWNYSGTLVNTDQSRGFSQIDRFLRENVIDYQRGKYGEGNPTLQFAISELLTLYIDFKPPKYEAAEVFMKRIANDRRRALGESNPATLEAEKQLIALYLIPQPKPKLDEAEDYLKTLIEVQRRTLGDDNPATQATINYLVNVYLDQPQYHYAEGETFLKQVKEDARRNLGSESLATRNASIGLASLYFKQARYREAADLLVPLASNAAVQQATTRPLTMEIVPTIMESLDRSSQVYGKWGNTALANSTAQLTLTEHPTIVDILERLSQIYSKQDNAPQAHAMANQLRKILEADLNSAPKTGSGNRSLATPLKNMGAISIRYIDHGSYSEAEDLLTTVVDGYRRISRVHVDAGNTAALSHSSAIPYINPGTDSQTGRYQQLAGSNASARDIASLLTSAAIAYTAKGKDLRAEQLLTDVLEINQDALGDNDWDTQRSLWRLAAWYMDRGRYEKAHGTFDRLHRVQAGFYGAGHTITRTTLIDTYLLYEGRIQTESAEGRKERVQFLLETILDIRNQVLVLFLGEPDGEKSGTSRAVMSGVGITLAKLGRYPQAAETFTRLIALQKTAEDVQQEAKPAPLASLGWIQFHQQQYPEAEASLREALRGYQQIQSDTWERYNTESMLGAALVATRKYDEAENYLLNSYEGLRQSKPGPGPASGFMAESEPGERVLTLYQEWGKPEKVAEWRQKLSMNKSASSTAPTQRQ